MILEKEKKNRVLGDFCLQLMACLINFISLSVVVSFVAVKLKAAIFVSLRTVFKLKHEAFLFCVQFETVKYLCLNVLCESIFHLSRSSGKN